MTSQKGNNHGPRPRDLVTALTLLLAACGQPVDDGVTAQERAMVRHCEATWIDGNPNHTPGAAQHACPEPAALPSTPSAPPEE